VITYVICVYDDIREECSRRTQQVTELESKLNALDAAGDWTAHVNGLCVHCAQNEATYTSTTASQQTLDTITRSVCLAFNTSCSSSCSSSSSSCTYTSVTASQQMLDMITRSVFGF